MSLSRICLMLGLALLPLASACAQPIGAYPPGAGPSAPVGAYPPSTRPPPAPPGAYPPPPLGSAPAVDPAARSLPPPGTAEAERHFERRLDRLREGQQIEDYQRFQSEQGRPQ